MEGRRILWAMADRSASPAARPRRSLRPPRWTVERFESIDSTNRWLLDAARAGAAAGLVAVADHQDAGRGRRGRSWESAPGASLLVSVLLRPDLELEHVQLVTMAAALALADAVLAVSSVDAGLKWPNDLVVGDRKLAGLLAEADVADGRVRALVVGAGCNLRQRKFPKELADLATSCFLESGREPERDEVLAAYLERLGAQLDDPERVLADYRARLVTLGRSVRVERERDTVVGIATDVDDRGRLVVSPPAREPVVIAAGDVVHLR